VISSVPVPSRPSFGRVIRACAVLATALAVGTALTGCGGSNARRAGPASASNGTHSGSPAAYHEPPSRSKALDAWEGMSRLIAIGQGATYFSTPCVGYHGGRSCVVTEASGETFFEYVVPSGFDRYHEWAFAPARNETVGDRVLSGEKIVNSLKKVVSNAVGGASTTPRSEAAAVVYMPAYGGGSSEKPAPSTFVVGNTTRDGFTWAGWGSPTAVGHGQVESNDCTPDCASGHVTWVRETVVLTHIVSCHGRRYYARLRDGSSSSYLERSTCTY
jgi:hypothetical protein